MNPTTVTLDLTEAEAILVETLLRNARARRAVRGTDYVRAGNVADQIAAQFNL